MKLKSIMTNQQQNWEEDFSNRYDLFRGNKDMMLDFIRQVHDEAYEMGRQEVLDSIPDKEDLKKCTCASCCWIDGAYECITEEKNNLIDQIHNNLK